MSRWRGAFTLGCVSLVRRVATYMHSPPVTALHFEKSMARRGRTMAIFVALVALCGREAHASSRAVRARIQTRSYALARRPAHAGGARALAAAKMSSTAPEPRREPVGELLRRALGGALAASAGCGLIVASGHELATKLAADVLSGCLAALAVSPFVALVDSAIARSVANKSQPQQELWQSIVTLARSPLSSLYRADFYYTCARAQRREPLSLIHI